MASNKCNRCGAAAGQTARFGKACGASIEDGALDKDIVAFGDAAIEALEREVDRSAPAAPLVEASSPEPLELLSTGSGSDPSETSTALTAGVSPAPTPSAAGTPHAGEARYSITIEDGAGAGEALFVKPGDTLVIGSDPDAQLTLRGDRYVSRRHARITLDGDRLCVEDVGSSNGTFVSARPADPLEDGQVLLVGRTKMRVRRG